MYPTRYNDEHEIIRYFDFLFIDSKEFWSTEDWELKISDTLADGVVYAVIPENKEDIAKIAKEITSGTYGERVVFCLPKKFTNIEKVAFEYSAVCELKNLVVDDDLLKDEYEIYIEDLEEVIGSFIFSYARPETGGADYYHVGKKVAIYRKAQMSALLSEICEKIYPHAPTINNESINKNFCQQWLSTVEQSFLMDYLAPSLSRTLGLPVRVRMFRL